MKGCQGAAGKKTAAQKPIQERQLQGWKLLEMFEEHLSRALERQPVPETELDSRRKLHRSEYLKLLLWAMWNPVIDSMRGLCAATGLKRVRKEICCKPVSLSSFSEMQAVVDPVLLETVLSSLSEEALKRQSPQRDLRLVQMAREAAVIDSSLFSALNRMVWAQWRCQWGEEHAVRLHVKLAVRDKLPLEAKVTVGKYCERAAWEEMARAGDLFVADRYYGEDYGLLAQMAERQVGFVVRMRIPSQWKEEEPIELRPEDEAAGVFAQSWVTLGCRGQGPRVRLIRIEGENDEVRLVTNLPEKEWPAELIAVLYRHRWVVELFFRWLKCLLGCRHFFCESEQGVTLQLYLALIAAVLFTLWTGKLPNKRQWEAIQFYFLGYASLDELNTLFSKASKPSRSPPSPQP